eukprot:8785634-Alexandrium_andersonii.AAC.1
MARRAEPFKPFRAVLSAQNGAPEAQCEAAAPLGSHETAPTAAENDHRLLSPAAHRPFGQKVPARAAPGVSGASGASGLTEGATAPLGHPK